MTETKCLQCAGEWKMYHIKKENGTLPHHAEEPILHEAITWAPNWQQQQIGAQIVMACIALPTCEHHMTVAELSAVDKAILGGKILPGSPV